MGSNFDKEFAWEVRKRGNILSRTDFSTNQGFYTSFIVFFENTMYHLLMRNGEIIRFECIEEQ